jgi:hypothetical protein
MAWLAAAAPAASAQFTSAVVPPKKPARAPEPAAVAQGPGARGDTAIAKRLTDMKAWVDSAAVALNVPTPAATDSARVPAPADSMRTAARTDSAPPRQTTASAGEVTSFHEGARAPNTATPLPLLALLGAGSLLAGSWLRRRRR